jgi:hypothetical protein
LETTLGTSAAAPSAVTLLNVLERGCAGERISAYVARNAFHATSPSALFVSSAR